MVTRQLWLVILFLLAASSVNAQYGTISPRIDSLRRYVTGAAELPYNGTSEVDTVKIIREIIFAIRQVCEDFPALEKFDTVDVDSIPEGGTLPTDYRLVKSAFLMLGDTLRLPLQNLEGDTMFMKRPTMLQNLMDLADFFSIRYYHVHGTQLLLHPKWWRGDNASILLEYWAIDTTTFDSGADFTLIRTKYREKIVDYAVSRLWAIRGNTAMADYWMREYDKGRVTDVD